MEQGVPSTAVIETDLLCAICGYNLKGLSAAGNCPECGQPVARTYQFDLVKADPTWLRRQAGTVPMVAALCFLGFCATTLGYAKWLSYSMQFLMAGINLWGSYRLGQADPADPTERYGSVRRGVFLASIAVLISIALQWPHLDTFQFSGSAQFWLWVRVALVGINTCRVFFLLAHICRRTGNKSLYKHARASLWAVSLAQPGYFMFLLFDFRRFAESAPYIYSAYSYLVQAALFLALILLGRVYEVLQAAAATAQSASSIQAPSL